MLDANENMSKNNLNLKQWIEKSTSLENRELFLNLHLIPDVNLDLENFDEYINERKEILMNKIKTILR